jgi:hypothetical protein
MGFALWVDGDTVWAQGTHEYRPMGVAVVGANCVFSPRDFRGARRGFSRFDPRFAGFFASLGEMNDYLQKRRSPKSRSQHFARKSGRLTTPAPPPF